jgi:chromosome segregation ATPase
VLLQAGGGPLDEVIKAIDEMVATLQEEESADLEKKETCEKNREDDTASARKHSLAVDDMTDTITRKTARIAELKSLIEAKEAENVQLAKDLEEATRNREDEKAAFEASKADDEAAAKLIQQAMDVLANFYKDNGMALVQKAAQAPTVEAGKAPPPPPKTWDAPYGGAKGESNGIQAILGIILEDVKADIEKSVKAEEEAIAEYEKMKKDTEAAIAANTKAIEDMKGEIATCEEDITTAKEERISAKGSLDSVLEEIKVAEPECDFMTINFGVRNKNRQMEIDGLLKAKAILQGGSFDAGPDPNREIKPGDAM